MRYKCIVAYDGTCFHGFQIQNDLRTVQLEIENVLKIIAKKDVKINSAGRTDTGVHAYGQVFHFDLDIEMKNWQMQNALNSRLPRDIYIKSVESVPQISVACGADGKRVAGDIAVGIDRRDVHRGRSPGGLER